jgi:lysophospholipase L1-like esterase
VSTVIAVIRPGASPIIKVGENTAEANRAATLSQAWAESPTEPGGAGTKSAKGWAEEAAATADATDAALSDLTASVDQITPLLDDALVPIYERPSTSSFPVGTFREWVTGASGAAIGAGTVIDAVVAYLVRPSAAATVEARLYSRAGTTWSASPDQDADTAEWADWVSLSTTGTTADVSTLFRFAAPAPVTVDAGRYYYVAFRAKQSGGSVANLGFGRWLSSATGAGTPWSQLERGYFRNNDVPVAWNPGLIGSVLPIRFEMRQSELALAPNDVPERPSPRIGTRIIAGRQEFVLDNGTSGRTYRAIFAIPAKAVWVRPIFAHAALTPVLIDAAAVAPIASAANFAASGVTWTPLRFNKATSGLIPAAAGSLRRGWLAADRCDVTTLDRTDVTGAAHLVAVSCFIRQTGTLTMMGNSAGTTDYTGWASRTDRPFVLRYNDGDCVTTPASFTSTTNRSTGPIVGIQYELESGEVVTLGGVGDSITDGAGGSLFGLSWGYNAALALQKAWRNADWVNLGWSGITMGGVANLATDFYAFARRAKLTVPTIMFTPNASPNSINPPITTVQMTNQRPLAEGIVRLAQQSGSVPIVWTIIPTNPSVKDYNSTDVERRNYNDGWRTDGAAGGIIVADMDAIMAGVTDGDGQVNIVAGAQTDGIHPNDTGHGLTRMGGVALRAAQAALPLAGFAVGELVT